MAGSTSPKTPVANQSDLWVYIHEDVWSNYAENRRIYLEPKWNRNRAAAETDVNLDPAGTWKKSEHAKSWQSDTFFDVTRQKIVTAKALGTDALFQGGRVAFMLHEKERGPMREQERDEATQELIDLSIDEGQALIHRQIRETDGITELSNCFDSAATYGCTWAKRFVHDVEETHFEEIEPGVYHEVVRVREMPGFEQVPIWDMYWDLEAADPVFGSDAIIQRQLTSAFELRELKTAEFYFPDAIDMVLDEQATDSANQSSAAPDDEESLPPRLRDVTYRSRTIVRLEAWGRAPRDKVEKFEAERMAIEQSLADGDDPDPASLTLKDVVTTDTDAEGNLLTNTTLTEDESRGDMVEVFVVTADNHVIAFARTEDIKERPYYYVEWEVKLDQSGGRGLADAVEYAQKVLNGAIRSFEDNKKLISNYILFIKKEMLDIDLEDGDDIPPGSIIPLSEEAEKATDAFSQPEFTDVGNSLVALIEMFMDFADLSSNIPRAQQGQQSEEPQTAFELQQRLERSGKYLGEVIRRFDMFIEKIINDMYKFNMADPEEPSGKGDFQVVALGFTSFQNRFVRLNRLVAIFNMFLQDPEIRAEINIRWLIEEITKANDIAPDQLLKSEAQKLAEREAQGVDPEAELRMANLKLEAEDRQSSTAKNNAQAEEARAKAGESVTKSKLEKARFIRDMERELGGGGNPPQPGIVPGPKQPAAPQQAAPAPGVPGEI